MPHVIDQAFYTPWRDLGRWDIKAAYAARLNAAYPGFHPLGEFIEEVSIPVHPAENPNHDWPVYGVNNTQGVFFSHYQSGKAFRSAYKRISKDWFFHNPTRANVGSLGRVPSVPDDAITSPEYQVWRIRSGLLPEFVELLLKTRYFLSQIDCHRVGTVKERLFVQNLQEIPIPVLDLPQQAAIIKRWQHAVASAEALRSEAESIVDSVDAQFLNALGLRVPSAGHQSTALSLSWCDLVRWSVEANSRNPVHWDLRTGYFPVVRLGNVIADLENGWSPKCLARPAQDEEWGVLKVGAVSQGVYNPTENKALPPHLPPKPELAVKSGDWIIGRANVSRLVGACALVKETPPRLMLCDKLFRAVWRRASPIDEAYLDRVLKLPHLRYQIESNATGTSVTMKNITKPALLALQLPLPPLAIQAEIASSVERGLARASALQDQARRGLEQAKLEIEDLILRDD